MTAGIDPKKAVNCTYYQRGNYKGKREMVERIPILNTKRGTLTFR